MLGGMVWYPFELINRTFAIFAIFAVEKNDRSRFPCPMGYDPSFPTTTVSFLFVFSFI